MSNSDLDNNIDLDDDLSDLENDNNNNDNNNNDNNNDEDVSNEFKEKVIAYKKYDDVIRQKMDEIKELKSKRKPCEEFIIKYLESKNAPFVNIKDGKLIKNKSESKGSLKAELIKEAILEGIKEEKLPNDDVKSNDITAKIMDIMDNKRSKTVNIKLRRTFNKKPKNNKQNNKYKHNKQSKKNDK